MSWFYVAESDVTDPESSSTRKTVRIDGNTVSTTDELFDCLSQYLEFPNYFGRNWSALEDCLGDLQWLGTNVITVIWFQCRTYFLKNPEDFLTFLDVFENSASWHKQVGGDLRLILSDDYLYRVSLALKNATLSNENNHQ
ncbi:MAG: barstar family protein [Capsulimonadales bacterium]|nr:barstar family protein [Capsulimonadales bacterium]